MTLEEFVKRGKAAQATVDEIIAKHHAAAGVPSDYPWGPPLNRKAITAGMTVWALFARYEWRAATVCKIGSVRVEIIWSSGSCRHAHRPVDQLRARDSEKHDRPAHPFILRQMPDDRVAPALAVQRSGPRRVRARAWR